MFKLRKYLYKVKIPYYEPTFALRLGRRTRYFGTIKVKAHNPEHAIRLALMVFESTRDLSWVQWFYEIVHSEISTEQINPLSITSNFTSFLNEIKQLHALYNMSSHIQYNI